MNTCVVLDAETAPSVADARAAMAAYSASGWLAYIGGPGAAAGDASWFADGGIGRLRAAGIPLLPVWVCSPGGSGSGAQVIAALQGAGFTSGPVVLDAETWGVVPGLPAAVATLRDRGYRPIVYGSASTCRSALGLPASTRPEVYVADYPDGQGPTPPPDLASSPVAGAVGWQYSDSGQVGGSAADLSVVAADLLGADPYSDDGEDKMEIVASTEPGQPTYGVVGGTVFQLDAGQDVAELQREGAKVIHLTPGSFGNFRGSAHV